MEGYWWHCIRLSTLPIDPIFGTKCGTSHVQTMRMSSSSKSPRGWVMTITIKKEEDISCSPALSRENICVDFLVFVISFKINAPSISVSSTGRIKKTNKSGVGKVWPAGRICATRDSKLVGPRAAPEINPLRGSKKLKKKYKKNSDCMNLKFRILRYRSLFMLPALAILYYNTKR